MADKIIKFPKEKSKRARAYLKAESKQALMTLSLVSLLIGVVVINDTVTRDRTTAYIISDNSSQVGELNRAIASARPMSLFRDIEWEHQLAEKLGQEPLLDERVPASVSRRLSSLDQLRYGPLGGKYAVVNRIFKDDPKIIEISYVDSVDVMDRPVFLNPTEFLSQYQELFAVSFSSVRPLTSVRAEETYALLGPNQEVNGTAVFTKDEDGRVLSIRFSASQQ